MKIFKFYSRRINQEFILEVLDSIPENALQYETAYNVCANKNIHS